MIGNDAAADRRQTDRSDFEAHLRPILPMAYRYAFRLAGNQDAGMDLVQDASVSAFRSFHLFVPGTNFKAWFLRILLHHFYRTRQIEARQPTVALADAPESFLYRQARRIGLPMKSDPVDVILGKVDSEAVTGAFERLPSEYRETAILHFITEMSYADCAEILEVPIGTVRSRLHRSRRLLQVYLWEIAETRGYVPAQESL
jgi:RNA polymerase sigma-70 factor (ECF subfamily)